MNFQNILYSVVCRFMDIHTPSGSGFTMIKRNDDNFIRWCINGHAFDYHDATWDEYKDLTVRIHSDVAPDTEGFSPIESMEEFANFKFYDLAVEFANNSSRVVMRNRGRHHEERDSEYRPFYWYSEDIEFVFENLYESDAVVSLRYAEYNDRCL